MSKSSFIDKISEKYNFSKSDAKRIVTIVFQEIITSMKELRQGKAKKVALGTVGSFYISERKSRRGRNPRTGEMIKIKASSAIRFRPSVHMKKAAGVTSSKR